MAYPDDGVVQTWLDALKRPAPGDRVPEIPIPLDYSSCEWLPQAVQDTANMRKRGKT